MKTFLLLLILLDAKTGEQLDHQFKGKPVTLEECITASIEMGPQPVENGVARVYTCYNLAAKPTNT